MPFSVLCEKLFYLLESKILFYFGWFNDLFFYNKSAVHIEKISLNFTIDSKKLQIDSNLNIAVENYLNHKFDLLGSGWTNVDIDSNASDDYKYINWNIDFKSGYSWQSKTWYKFIKYGNVNGVDIKVPWELSRLQHLPQLAIAYSAQNCDIQLRKKIKLEFENQVLDFIENNLPRFGVNWVCTMDVGIRAANMVIAYEILLSSGVIFDKNFQNIFLNSVCDHGTHIVNNLEWSESLTSNHYLANVVGLLFISSILKTTEADTWLYFSVNELLNEFSKQYYDDGGNFESSTSYHRLSTEMVAYSAALILGFDDLQWNRIKSSKYHNFNKSVLKNDILKHEIIDNKLPNWFISRLYKSLMFTHTILKDNFEIAQIGDNDSGRFFKFSIPGDILRLGEAKKKYINLNNYESSDLYYLDENILDHRSISIALKSLFGVDLSYVSKLEDFVFTMFAKNNYFESLVENNHFRMFENPLIDLNFNFKEEFVLKSKFITDDLLESMQLHVFPESGIYLFKNIGFYLLISACPNGQNGNGGHAHNDKLSFELVINGESVFLDPGTFLYTPDPEMRNLFRSVNAHNSIITDSGEQNNWLPGRFGLFNLENQSKCKLLHIAKNKIILENSFKNVLHRRSIELDRCQIKVIDYCNIPFKQNIEKFDYYSNGYGKLMKSKLNA
jgi:hypothetical protein